MSHAEAATGWKTYRRSVGVGISSRTVRRVRVSGRHSSVVRTGQALSSGLATVAALAVLVPTVRFQAGHIPSRRGSCERYTLSLVAVGSDWSLPLPLSLLSAAWPGPDTSAGCVEDQLSVDTDPRFGDSIGRPLADELQRPGGRQRPCPPPKLLEVRSAAAAAPLQDRSGRLGVTATTITDDGLAISEPQ